MVSRSPGPSKRKAPTELDSVGTRQDGCQAGGQNYRILRSYRRLGGRLAGSGYGGLCLLESAESSPPSKAQGAMTESRRGPLLASERTPRKAPASWTLVAAEPALRGGLGAVTNCCHAAKPLSPIVRIQSRAKDFFEFLAIWAGATIWMMLPRITWVARKAARTLV